VEIFRHAGVTTVMITGDHVDTAYAIARQLGIAGHRSQCITGRELERLDDTSFLKRIKDLRVYARVTPAQKVRIVKGLQLNGEIVAMTGDGVNDAPSLKAADIGVAMGTGVDVAKQAADMILADDNFATIEKAIEEGRGVYENIRKSVIFLLSSNLGELMTMFVAVAMGLASPLKSSHILWINLITDSLPALALGVDKNDSKSLMRCPPRKASESLFARGGIACTLFYGALITVIGLAAFLVLPCGILAAEGELVGNPFTWADSEKGREVLGRIMERSEEIPVYVSSNEVLSQISGFKLARGMLCAMRRRALPKMEELCRDARRIAILENVVNPTNVGAIFRSAAALGIDAVLLTAGCSDPLYRRAARVSMGTVFQVPWTFLGTEDWADRTMAQLRGMGYRTAAMALKEDSLSPDARVLHEAEKLAIILGTEGEGLAADTIADCDYTVCIPMARGVDSLNVAAASAVAFWELCR
jgi:tRNA G18 (ribose-2'-O)-methylase SpoU